MCDECNPGYGGLFVSGGEGMYSGQDEYGNGNGREYSDDTFEVTLIAHSLGRQSASDL